MMRNPASLLNLLRKLRIGWLAVVGLALVSGGPFGARVLDAQGPPDLEALHQRLLPSSRWPALRSLMRTSEAADWSLASSTVALKVWFVDGFEDSASLPRASTWLRRSRFSRLPPFATIRVL